MEIGTYRSVDAFIWCQYILGIKTSHHIRPFDVTTLEVHQHLVAHHRLEEGASALCRHRGGNTYPGRSHCAEGIGVFLCLTIHIFPGFGHTLFSYFECLLSILYVFLRDGLVKRLLEIFLAYVEVGLVLLQLFLKLFTSLLLISLFT